MECRLLHGSGTELEWEYGKTGEYKKQAGCFRRHGLLRRKIECEAVFGNKEAWYSDASMAAFAIAISAWPNYQPVCARQGADDTAVGGGNDRGASNHF
jgi:hypothetical protein